MFLQFTSPRTMDTYLFIQLVIFWGEGYFDDKLPELWKVPSPTKHFYSLQSQREIAVFQWDGMYFKPCT